MNNIGYIEHGTGALDPDAHLPPIVGDCRICGNGIHKGSEERIDGEIVCVSCFEEAESPELKVRFAIEAVPKLFYEYLREGLTCGDERILDLIEDFADYCDYNFETYKLKGNLTEKKKPTADDILANLKNLISQYESEM